MTRQARRRRTAVAALSGRVLVLASTSYVANCALGAGVALRVINTRRCRWLHHVLYGVTTSLTATATAGLIAARSPAAATLAPALVPLALMPRMSPRTARHARVGLAAAPFFLASWIRSR